MSEILKDGNSNPIRENTLYMRIGCPYELFFLVKASLNTRFLTQKEIAFLSNPGNYIPIQDPQKYAFRIKGNSPESIEAAQLIEKGLQNICRCQEH